MPVTQQESHHLSVLAGQGEIGKLRSAVETLANREHMSTGDLLLSCKDDYHQTAAHMAAKSGQAKSIHALAGLFQGQKSRIMYFNMANRFSGDRPVHTAMRHGFLAVFKALVAHGADPLVKNRFGDGVADYLGDFEPSEVQHVLKLYEATASVS